jgi:hypothetical protein
MVRLMQALTTQSRPKSCPEPTVPRGGRRAYKRPRCALGRFDGQGPREGVAAPWRGRAGVFARSNHAKFLRPFLLPAHPGACPRQRTPGRSSWSVFVRSAGRPLSPGAGGPARRGRRSGLWPGAPRDRSVIAFTQLSPTIPQASTFARPRAEPPAIASSWRGRESIPHTRKNTDYALCDAGLVAARVWPVPTCVRVTPIPPRQADRPPLRPCHLVLVEPVHVPLSPAVGEGFTDSA